WVPGTSRPAPAAGERLAPPPGTAPAQPAVEETGPHFFDEDPVEEPPAAAPAPASPAASVPSPSPAPSQSPAESQHGSRPEPASAWGADRSRQSGFGGGQDRRNSWGSDPRAPLASAPDADGAAADPAAGAPAAAGGAGPAAPAGSARQDEGTMTFRAVAPAAGGTPAAPAPAAALPPSGPQQAAAPAVPPQTSAPRTTPAAPAASTPAPAPAAPAPAAPPLSASGPLTGGAGGGQSSWAQQVHRLAGGDEPPVVPWKPPTDDPFQAAARRQAEARPAPLGKRFAARLLDTVVLGAVTAVAAVPLGGRAMDHIDEKIETA